MRGHRRFSITLPRVEQLLEDWPIPNIKEFFAARNIALVVHTDPPAQPSEDELRRMPRSVRRAIEANSSTHWVDLGTVWLYYGSGTSEEAAIRRAAQRYRVEQADPEASAHEG